LRKALEITQMMYLNFSPDSSLWQLYPGLDFSTPARATPQHAAELWKRMQAGAKPFRWAQTPKHSDDVVAIDKAGNIAAITQSINCVDWGAPPSTLTGFRLAIPRRSNRRRLPKSNPAAACLRRPRPAFFSKTASLCWASLRWDRVCINARFNVCTTSYAWG
jgi:gamma-glutamyltranspeptidase/glutathione hydrolase